MISPVAEFLEHFSAPTVSILLLSVLPLVAA